MDLTIYFDDTNPKYAVECCPIAHSSLIYNNYFNASDIENPNVIAAFVIQTVFWMKKPYNIELYAYGLLNMSRMKDMANMCKQQK